MVSGEDDHPGIGMEHAELRNVLDKLEGCRGVLSVRLLDEEEKDCIMRVEGQAEDKTLWGMCKSLNQGLREAVSRKYTIAMVIDTSKFEYPHHPYTRMECEDLIVGEQVMDEEKIKELKKDPTNLFLWNEFVVYVKKIPRDPERRKKLRVVFLPRAPPQLTSTPSVEKGVFGVPSVEGDLEIKKLLGVKDERPEIGSCVIGLEVKIVPMQN